MSSHFLLLSYLIATCFSASPGRVRELQQMMDMNYTTTEETMETTDIDFDNTEDDGTMDNTEIYETTTTAAENTDNTMDSMDEMSSTSFATTSTDSCVDEDFLGFSLLSNACQFCVCGETNVQACEGAATALANAVTATGVVNTRMAENIIATCNLECEIENVGLADGVDVDDIDSCDCDLLQCTDGTDGASQLTFIVAMAAVFIAVSWI